MNARRRPARAAGAASVKNWDLTILGTSDTHGNVYNVAANNCRRSGGGNFPGIAKTQVYNQQQEIRQLLIDWAQAKGVIDPADFFVPNWKLVREGVPVF